LDWAIGWIEILDWQSICNQLGRAVHNNAAMTSRTRSRISGKRRERLAAASPLELEKVEGRRGTSMAYRLRARRTKVLRGVSGDSC
jgi:hypothetical protein